MSLINLLQNFHNAILEDDAEIARNDIKPNGRVGASEQLAIYIDGYRIRLVQAIRSDYPDTLALLGGVKFDRLALEYIKNNPPTSFNLDRYPHDFARYVVNEIVGFPAEIARLESAIAKVFMMPESKPLSANAFVEMSGEEIASVILKPRTSSKLLAFNYDVNEWTNLIRSGETPKIPEICESFLYVYRHKNNVKRTVLAHSEHVVLSNLFSGLTLESALEKSVESNPKYEEEIAENIQGWLANWLSSGFFSDI